MYGFEPEGGPRCRGRDTIPKRLSRSSGATPQRPQITRLGVRRQLEHLAVEIDDIEIAGRRLSVTLWSLYSGLFRAGWRQRLRMLRPRLNNRTKFERRRLPIEWKPGQWNDARRRQKLAISITDLKNDTGPLHLSTAVPFLNRNPVAHDFPAQTKAKSS